MPELMVFFATILGFAGCGGVHFGWQRQSLSFALAGWLGIFASIVLWIVSQGIEFGLVYGLCVPSIYVWYYIAKESKQTPERTIVKPQTLWRFRPRAVLSNTALVLFVLPCLLIISSLVTINIVYYLPVPETSQMAIGVLLIPFMWAFIACWLFMANNKLWPVAISALMALISALQLFT